MKLEKRHIPELRNLIAENYRKDYVLLNQKFFDWCFHSSDGYTFRVLEVQNRLAGMIGIMPYDFKFLHTTARAHFLLNLMIDAPLRNFGLGPRLVLEAGNGADLVYTTSYGENAKPMYQKLQWTEMGWLNRQVCILDLPKCRALAQTELPDEIQQDFSDSGLLEISSFGKSQDDFWNSVRSKYPITIERTSDYLNWRYSEHPVFKYHMLQYVHKGDVHAYAVLRFEEPPGYKIARIIDFISNDSAEELMLNKIRDYCKAQGACLVDFMFTGSFHMQSLKQCNWKNANQEPYSRIPLLFNPLDRTRKDIPFAFKILKASLPAANNLDKWYITKGDGDQDRPN